MKHFPVQILFFLFLFASCRENIVQPENTAGNKNEPFSTRTNYSYSFTINAEEITREVTDKTNLNSFKSRISITVNNHSSGSAEIKIETGSNQLIYYKTINSNTSGISTEIEGNVPNLLTINFVNFTGILKIVLTEID